MTSSFARALAERIWRAEIRLQRAQRNLRFGTDEARREYAYALMEMEETHRLVSEHSALDDWSAEQMPNA